MHGPRRASGPGPEAIERAAACLRAGGVVAFPTETVYGLGANALDTAAVARVYALKGRPATSPLIVHVADTHAARALAARWPDAAQRLSDAFWPGPLTLVVPKAPHVPDGVTGALATVGLRVPSHPVAHALLAAAGVPLAAPSANRFTRLSATCAEHVHAAFPEGVDVVLDGGPTAVGIESTVVSLAGDVPRLLRHGAIPLARLRDVVGRVDEPPADPGPGAHAAPGPHSRHYSPRTPLVLLHADAAAPAGRGVRVRRGGAAVPADEIALPADPAGYAARLYATLHELDARGLDWIAVDLPPPTAEWAAVRDRLRRGAGGGGVD